MFRLEEKKHEPNNKIDYATRRHKLLEKLSPDSIALIPSPPASTRTADIGYPYRQSSHLYYLTGFEEPESVAICFLKDNKPYFILFNLPNDPKKEMVDGKITGQDNARLIYGADESYPIHELKERLPLLLKNKKNICYPIGLYKYFDALLSDMVADMRSDIRRGLQAEFVLADISYRIDELRAIKDDREIELIRKSVSISTDAHIRAMLACKPNQYEYALQAELEYEFTKSGALATAYPSIVGAGENSCILHYDTNTSVIKEGDIVLVDAGAEYQKYTADITRTYPANGKFSPQQKSIYDIVLRAQQAGIRAVYPGSNWGIVSEAVSTTLAEGLAQLGLLNNNLADFYRHGPGHWLGLDVHDVGRYKFHNQQVSFEPGMVLTVEPGIYISRDIPNISAEWRNIGVRIEDVVLVTADGREVLSAALPKQVEDIETLMQLRLDHFEQYRTLAKIFSGITDANVIPLEGDMFNRLKLPFNALVKRNKEIFLLPKQDAAHDASVRIFYFDENNKLKPASMVNKILSKDKESKLENTLAMFKKARPEKPDHLLFSYTTAKSRCQFYPYQPGIPLSTYLERARDLTLQDRLDIAYLLMKDLSSLHQKNVIHLGLETQNVMYDPNTHTLNIINFEHAVSVPQKIHYLAPRHPSVKFNRDTAPPEYGAIMLSINRVEVTPAMDIYTAGIILGKILGATDDSIFLSKTSAEEKANHGSLHKLRVFMSTATCHFESEFISPTIAAFLEKMTAANPNDRPTAKEVSQFLLQQLVEAREQSKLAIGKPG